MPSELRRRRPASEIDDAARFWGNLVEGVVFTPLAEKKLSGRVTEWRLESLQGLF